MKSQDSIKNIPTDRNELLRLHVKEINKCFVKYVLFNTNCVHNKQANPKQSWPFRNKDESMYTPPKIYYTHQTNKNTNSTLKIVPNKKWNKKYTEIIKSATILLNPGFNKS